MYNIKQKKITKIKININKKHNNKNIFREIKNKIINSRWKIKYN